MGAGKNKAHRKKRISKHVREAQERKSEKGDTAVDSAPRQEKKPSKSRKNKKVKDPSEAASYLSTWKHRNAGADVWKFNKNTQSWLIRHMYEADKVPKATFEILMEYIANGGESLRSRVNQDATRRALRYKQFEKGLESSSRNDKDNTEADVQADKHNETEDDKDDAARWKALSDYEKRKEYKRSRKILDLLKDSK